MNRLLSSRLSSPFSPPPPLPPLLATLSSLCSLLPPIPSFLLSSSFFILFPCSDVGLYDPHVVYETRGRIDGRNARVRSSPLVPLVRRPQWGHMSKQLAHRCIEFTEENGGGRSKESWCCVIGAPPWARSSSTGRSTSRDGCCSPSFLFPGMEKNSCWWIVLWLVREGMKAGNIYAIVYESLDLWNTFVARSNNGYSNVKEKMLKFSNYDI